jgi:hypothetical protein
MRFIPALAASFALVTANFAIYAAPASAASCVQTKISKTEFYFPGQAGSGYVVVFASTLGVSSFKNTHATIVDRFASAGSPISRAHAGDVVKLCLTQTPVAGNGCNPSKDNRGRIYSAYDQRLKASFNGANSDHLCGGA